ncbi:MAG: hypothetical protein ACRECH_15670, partial [Nitrososphaerales archaeon]
MTRGERLIPCPACGYEVSTETDFSIWVRNQSELESNKYRLSIHDRDWVIERGIDPRYGQALAMIIEEKTRLAQVPLQQLAMLRKFHEMCMSDLRWRGSHILQFENTSPENGRIYLDGSRLDTEELIKFIRFEMAPSWYRTTLQQVD